MPFVVDEAGANLFAISLITNTRLILSFLLSKLGGEEVRWWYYRVG